MPKLYVMNSNIPNAFAFGWSGSSVVVVTSKLMDMLNRDELQGVVAHEFTHIINYDIRLMLLVSALGNALLLFTDFLFRFVGLGSTGRSSSNNDNKGPGAIVILFLATL